MVVFAAVVTFTMSQAVWFLIGTDILKALDWGQVGKISLRTTIYMTLMLLVGVGFMCLWLFVNMKDVFDIMDRIGLPAFAFNLSTFEGEFRRGNLAFGCRRRSHAHSYETQRYLCGAPGKRG